MRYAKSLDRRLRYLAITARRAREQTAMSGPVAHSQLPV
jgi:hypothetical protein